MGRTKKKKRKWLIVLLAIALLAIGIFLLIRSRTVPIIQSVSEERVKALTVTAVNEAILEVVSETHGAYELTEIIYDSEQKIQMIQVKSALVNSLAQHTTLRAQEKLEKLGSHGIEIPLGTLTGAVMFTGKGPQMTIHVMPVGSITTRFYSEFTAAGINQTNHKIYIEISADISVIFPGANKKVSSVTNVIVNESIIIGAVPEVYLNSNTLDTMLDLIP